MITIEYLAETIEKLFYILKMIKEYCGQYHDIEEILPIEFSTSLLIKNLDKVYAILINDKNILR